MTSSSFRDSMNSLGWSRRDPEIPVSTAPQGGFMSSLQTLNPFGNPGYVSLPTTENAQPRVRNEEEGWLSLSRWDRMLIFGACNLGAVVCFALCFILFPVLWMKPSKFVTLWSLGSILFMGSFIALMGPMPFFRHLFSGQRLPFTAAYLGSIALCFYATLGLHSQLLAIVSAVIQLAALLWYLVSYFPMGADGLRVATSFGARQAGSWLTG